MATKKKHAAKRAKPASSKVVVTKSQRTQSAAKSKRQVAAKPKAAKPKAVKPKAAKPRAKVVAKPKAVKPKAVKAKAAKPKAAKPKSKVVAKPKSAKPKPKAAKPKSAKPRAKVVAKPKSKVVAKPKPASSTKAVAVAKPIKVVRRPVQLAPGIGRRVKKTLPEPPKPKTKAQRHAEAVEKAAGRQRERLEKLRLKHEQATVQANLARMAKLEKEKLAADKAEARRAAAEREAAAKIAQAEERARQRTLAALEKAENREAERRRADHAREQGRAAAAAAAEKTKQLALVAMAIKKAEREADKIAAADALAEKKKRHAAYKADELARKLAAKTALAEAKLEQKQRARGIAQALDELDKAATKRQGVTDGELLDAALTVLAGRAGVHVERKQGPPLTAAELQAVAQHAPLEALVLLRELGPIEFSWNVEGGAFGGSLIVADALSPSALDWRDRARRSFAEVERRDVVRGRLLATAVPRFTSNADLLACLEARGLNLRQAKALLALLGEDARAWFEATATPEGRRRAELIQAASQVADPNSPLPAPGFVAKLNQAPALDKVQWNRVCTEHGAFLDSDGGGGRFEITIEGGLPRAAYRKVTTPAGQASLPFENLTGLKCAHQRFSFANFCGVRAERTSFAHSELVGTVLSFAHLPGANFSGAHLRGADFGGADLGGADFRRADLTDVSFEKADLRGAHFAGAITSGTGFGGANVQGIKY